MPTIKILCRREEAHVVEFETRDGAVRGVAYADAGHGETQYEIARVNRLDAPAAETMTAIPAKVGSFAVIGRVTSKFEDDVSVVRALGFEFWLDPRKEGDRFEIGTWVAVQVENLTLFI